MNSSINNPNQAIALAGEQTASPRVTAKGDDELAQLSHVNYFVRFVLPQIEITLPGIVTPHHSKLHF